MSDFTCLAEGLVVPADFDKTGINSNELVVGPTGCGKSISNAYSRLLHTTDSSVVVPISKKDIKEKFMTVFKKRGYDVVDLDFTHPEKCEVGYDPLDNIHSDGDVIQLARNIMGGMNTSGKSAGSTTDPYWIESAISLHAARIEIIRLLAEKNDRRASYAEVINLQRKQKITDGDSSLIKTNIDILFEHAEATNPGNRASELWKTVSGIAPRTASCIYSVESSAIDKIFSKEILEMTKKEKRISFKDLGRKKTALFITTSPVNKTLQNYVNVLYADMFKELFELAESNDTGKLDTPVHIICDDFACGSRINDFEEYISIFRATGISVTMLLQSETQLNNMYGDNAASTIINNCDTYVYMGGMDIDTCRNISQRVNKPLSKVLAMPLEQVIVFRRGNEPYIARRYQTLEDPEYIRATEMSKYKKLGDRAAYVSLKNVSGRAYSEH